MYQLLLIAVLSHLLWTTQAIKEEDHQDSLNVAAFNRIFEDSDRAIRSSHQQSCEDKKVPCLLVMFEDANRTLNCNCSSNYSVIWRNDEGNILSNTSMFLITQHSLKINNALDGRKLVLYCSDGYDCMYKFIVSQVEITSAGMPAGVKGFIIFLVASVIFLSIIFLCRKFKSQLYLYCRDSCIPSHINDGKQVDAYFSIGKSESDRKFIEKNIAEILERELNYKLFIDDENILPRLDYSDKVQENMHKCRRLIIVFTPAYMTNEWCMYCFSEGLRKLLELNIQMIFIVSDVTIRRELISLSSLIGHVPKIYMSLLPTIQNKSEKKRIIQKIRLHMPPSRKKSAAERGMEAPMLSDAEDIDMRSLRADKDTYGGTKYTFGRATKGGHKDDVDMDEVDAARDALEYDDEDPNSIEVNQYEARKDFFRITLVDDA